MYQWKNDRFSNKYIRNHPQSEVERIFAEHEAEKEANAILSRYDGEDTFKKALLAKLAQEYLGTENDPQ